MPAAYQGRLRNIINTLLFTSFSVAASATIAAPAWQGPYVGVYAGGGFGNNHTSTNAGSVSDTSYFTTSADINAVNNAGTATTNTNTAMGGVQIGHDWSSQQIVYGLVIDYGTMPLNASNTVTQTYPDNTNQYSVYTAMTTNWLFTLRGRLGYQITFPRINAPTLLYLTGGMAMTQVNVKNNFSDNSSLAGAGVSSTSKNQIGWTAGVGIEVLSFAHGSVDLEYLYVHMPSVTTTGNITNTQAGFGIPQQSLSNSFATTGQWHANLLRIALNYRFDE